MLTRIRAALFGCGCLVAGALLGANSAPAERIVFLSVGQGDCALVQSAGRTVLIDTGPSSPGFDSGERILLPKLRELGVESVDLILLSHPDLDHVGGTPAVLRRYPGARVAISEAFRNDADMREHLRDWKVEPSRIDWLGPESAGRFGSLDWRLCCPPKGEEANDGSMFVRLGRPGAEAVLSGDAPSYVERRELLYGDWRATVMKAGHHGSRTSSDPRWLAAVHPRWVVVSCGRDNRYGHPNPEALARIAASGARLARTDREGDIAFEWRSEGLVRATP